MSQVDYKVLSSFLSELECDPQAFSLLHPVFSSSRAHAEESPSVSFNSLDFLAPPNLSADQGTATVSYTSPSAPLELLK